MPTLESPTLSRAWANAILPVAHEFAPTPLPLVAGQIPMQLRGSLYRNGPGRLARGNQRVGHWFDGDGAVLAIHFTDNGATGLYRFVQTTGYQAESDAKCYLFPNYGMTAPGWLWQRWGKPVKNCANTSVLALSDQLLALWEAGNPYSLDLQTLATRGTNRLSSLKSDTAYSAHPKVDPKTGEIYNFGVSVGLKTTLHLYRSNSQGKIIQTGEVPLDGLPLIHDFVLAGRYLIFMIPPVRVNLLMAGLGLSSFSEAMQWQPRLGTEVLVIDRESLILVSRGGAEPWYQWHFCNGYEEDRTVVIDLIRYSDFQTNQYLREVATGRTQTEAVGTFWRVHLYAQKAQVTKIECVVDRGSEFPVVPAAQVGQKHRYAYFSTHRADAVPCEELFGAIARYDSFTGDLTVAEAGTGCYPSEPVYAPHPDPEQPGWVLTVVYDGTQDQSEVWVYQSDRLDEEPVCRLALPSVIPHSFHGTWKPA